MTGPALRGLKRALPGVRITLMASPAGSQAAPLLPWVDDTFVCRTVWQDASGSMPLEPDREARLVNAIRTRNFDAAVVFTSFSQSPYPPAYICYLAGIPIRLGQSKEFGGSVLSHWVKPLPDEVHQVDRNLHLLQAAGLEAAGNYLELYVPPHVQESGDRLLREAGIDPLGPFLTLAPGASCPSRRYDPTRYGEVARRLITETGLPVAIVGAERDREFADRILEANANHRVASLVGRNSVPELAAILRRARLLIANNSGPMHMADALRCPAVILFAGTETPEQWLPRNTAARVLRRPTHCSPCRTFHCHFQMECLDIPPAEVVEEALSLLGQTRNRNLQPAREENLCVDYAS